jgi:hypothetical protein
MDTDSQLTTIEYYRLHFATPKDFISSLQKLINFNLRQSKIPISFDISLKDENGTIANSDFDDWLKGKNDYYIIATKSKKVLAKIVAFNINSKRWFRYEVMDKKFKVQTPEGLIIKTLKEIFSEYSVLELPNSLNFLPQSKKNQIVKQGQYKFQLKLLRYPIVLGYFGLVYLNLSYLIPALIFPCFIGLTHLIHGTYVRNRK